jgi:3-isopropylmalate dehydrogenase
MKIIVIPGDGIGPETMSATTAVLEAASQRFDLKLDLHYDIAGHDSLKQHGSTVTPELLATQRRRADARPHGHV